MTGLDPHRPKADVRASGRLFLALALLVIGWASLATPVAASAAQALDVVFVLDNSGSMKTNDPSFLTRRAVADFADAISKRDEVDPRLGLVIFDSRVRLAQPLTAIGDSPSRDALTGVLAALDFSGQRTNSPAAIERAIYELRENGREEARKAIIFLSDGKIDTGDAQNDAEVARWLREDLAQESETSGIRIFGIAFTESADYQLMQALARRTGARYYRAFEATELSAVVGDLLARVDEAPSYDLAYIDEPTPLPTSFPDTGDSGRAGDSERSGGDPVAEPQSRMIGWLPIVLLLVGALALANRKRLFFRGSRARNSVDELGQSPPPAQLLDLGGLLGESGESISLGAGRTTIGRDPHNDVLIADDTVSSEHAVIEVRDGVYWIQDRRSTNGTRLANKKLVPEQRYALKGGDRIRFADVDLMFVVEGYVPGGDTVYLSSSTTPPHGSSVYGGEPRPAAAARPAQPLQDAAADDVDVPSQEIVFAEARERLDPASVFDLDDALPEVEAARPKAPKPASGSDSEAVARADRALAAISAGNSVDPEVEIFPSDEPSAGLDPMEAPTAEVVVPGGQAAVPEVPEIGPKDIDVDVDVDATALGACLDYHLDRVAEISPDFAAFVKRGFGDELRTALPIAAKELIEEAQQSGKIAQRAYTRDRIRYVLCGLPCDMNQAQGFFGETFGGFTRVLSEQLRASSFRADRCEILALLSFGYGNAPWVSLSVVPDEGQTPRIDLLSYEFLTDKERTEIEPKSDPQISQSGLA